MNIRVVFMGSPDFAVPTLCELYHEFEVVGVITQRDKARGRGRKVSPTAVKNQALALGISVAEFENLSSSEAMEVLTAWWPDIIVVAAYGRILPEWVLKFPRMGCVNLHASLLPRHRGASPISAAILAGDKVTGVCTILMDKGMDTGGILLEEEIAIKQDDTAGTLHDRLVKPGADLVVRTIKKMAENQIVSVPQDNEAATYTRPLSKSDGRLNWALDAEYLGRVVRAMNPWPGAFCNLHGEIVKVWDVVPEGGEAIPGLVKTVGQDGIAVGTGSGILKLRIVQAPSKNRLSGSEFAKGRRLREGDTFD